MKCLAGILCTLLTGAVSFATPTASLASSSNPNPDANPRCPFGPGVARWDIKTSVPSGAMSALPTRLDLDSLIHAPDLQVSQATVAAARTQVMSHGTMALSSPAPFNALLKWSRPAIPFTLRLAPITPQLLEKAKRYAMAAQANGEAAPSTFGAILTAQLDDERISDPVEIGDVTAYEGQTVTASGTVVASTCEKDDGDFHIDLGSGSSDECAVVEVSNPYYIRNAELRSKVNKAEGIAKGLRVGDHIAVIGQLFYDTAHGGNADPGGRRGKGYCARSLWEIHPVFDIQTVEGGR